MQIDVTKLLSNMANTINISGIINIPKELLENSRIDELDNVYIDGLVNINEEYDLTINATIKGTMVLKDDLTLEPVNYNFSTDIEEDLPNNQNIIDITDVLWQNILLEIPSKVRSTDEDDIHLSGDGWRVISEEQYEKERNKQNNPFSSIDELLKTKEDK